MANFKSVSKMFALTCIGLGLSQAPALAGGEWQSEPPQLPPAGDYYGDYKGPSEQVNVEEEDHWEVGNGTTKLWASLGYVDAEYTHNLYDHGAGTVENLTVKHEKAYAVTAGFHADTMDWFALRGEAMIVLDSDVSLGSFSYDTSLDRLYRVELEAALHLYRDRGITVSGLLGYTLDDMVIGAYSVRNKAPYIGLGITAELDGYGYITARGFMSKWVETTSDLSSSVYGGESLYRDGLSMHGFEVAGHFNIRDSISAYLAFDYRKYEKANIVSNLTVPGATGPLSREFGSETFLYKVGLSYTF